MRGPVLVLIVAAGVGAIACRRGAPEQKNPEAAAASPLPSSSSTTAPAEGALDAPVVAVDPWTLAAEDEGEALRLADRVPVDELVTRAQDPKSETTRTAALRALGHAEDPSALPALADVAASEKDSLAALALESIHRIASARRRQVDPEDAPLLREGVDKTLAYARDTKRPKALRASAVSSLRMFADRSLVDPAAIPTDVDAK
ncbi:MAG: hypothetical protein U0169_05815 [Polyangiaceae bacterium]